jgi:NAD(P)-dependent dehydrogenase (short-subunit alcohol dehydrogenase family)
MNSTSIFRADLFKGYSMFVTGSSQGIGEATAELFAQLGAQVVVHGRNTERCARIRERILSAGGRCDMVTGDLAKTEDVERIADAVRDAVGGRLDYLIHNAALCEQRAFDQISLEEWQQTLAANLTSNFRLTQKLLPAIEAAAGKSIVLVSSVVTLLGLADSAAYSASKAGQIGLMRTMAWELGRKNIRVNAVLPGLVLVDRITRQFGPDYGKKIAGQYQFISTSILPEDIAASIAYLCSEAGRTITGQCIDINGGWICS